MGDAIVTIAIKRGIAHAFNQLLKATDMSSRSWGLAAHQNKEIDCIESKLELLFVTDERVNGLGKEQWEVLRAMIQPRFHQFETLHALLGDGTTLEFSLQNKDHVDGKFSSSHFDVD